MRFHNAFRPAALFPAIYADKRESDPAETEVDHPPAQGRDDVVMPLGNAGLNGVRLPAIESEPLVESAGTRISRLGIGQQNLRRAVLEDHVGDFGIAKIAQILRG